MTVDGELVPGGDLRVTGNAWLREAFQASGLTTIIHENQLRLAIQKIMKRMKIGTSSLFDHIFSVVSCEVSFSISIVVDALSLKSQPTSLLRKASCPGCAR